MSASTVLRDGRLPRLVRRQHLVAWVAGTLLGLYHYVALAVDARTFAVERFDGGIQSSVITYLTHGQFPITDYYEPYGIGIGLPGLLPRLVGVDGLFAERLVYALFPAAVTTLAVVVTWRRCGAVLALLVGVATLPLTTSRYAMGWVPVLTFLLMLDAACGPAPDGGLLAGARTRPRLLLAASLVLSLAGWARFEYAVFALLWAGVLIYALRGRERMVLAGATLGFALLPTMLVILTGGARHLAWFVDYTLGRGADGFHARRGQPIMWHFVTDRIKELWHGQLAGPASIYVSSYGVAVAVILATAVMLLVPRGRVWLLQRDPTYATPFIVLVCLVVLYGQAARFSDVYGIIGVPVFWVAGALVVGRLPPWATILVGLVLVIPLANGHMPGNIADQWQARPPVGGREAIAHLNRIPTNNDAEAQSMAALPRVWAGLGLKGRATISVSRRNDVDWANDAIVSFLLDAPAAAWPLTYDPGLVNRDAVQAEVVEDLCRSRAPVVQNVDDYPDPHGREAYIGSRRLDQFLAVDYHVRAVAGFYRILEPVPGPCVRPERLGTGELGRRRDSLFAQGAQAEAGSLAIERLDRAGGGSPDPDDAAVAAVGGYRLTPAQLPAGVLGVAVHALQGDGAVLPNRGWGAGTTDLQRIALQTAWLGHHQPTDTSTPALAAAALALARRHPRWPQAWSNVASVVPPPRTVAGQPKAARGVPSFDQWVLAGAAASGDVEAYLRAGLQVVRDAEGGNDPVLAGNTELALSGFPGLNADCSLALRRRANARPGVRAPSPPGPNSCPLLARLGG